MKRLAQILGITILIVVIMGILLAVRSLTPSVAQVPVTQTVKTETPTPEGLLALVNAERAKAGVKPLTVNPDVQKSAQLKADDMALYKYTGHIMPSTGKVLSPEMDKLLSKNCRDSSENLLWNTKDMPTGFNWWVESPAHHAAMIDDSYDTTGIAVKNGYVVQHFCDL